MCAAESLSMTGFAAFTTLLPALVREWNISNSAAGAIGGIFGALAPVARWLYNRREST